MDQPATHHTNSQLTFGQRAADQVAKFGGSWLFISLFGMFMMGWTVLNTELLGKTAFDPYPYVFLNLVLSMLAAIQAPIIMMSQNRFSDMDRSAAQSNYLVNLKAQAEIQAVHHKLESMQTEEIRALLLEQNALLARVLANKAD